MDALHGLSALASNMPRLQSSPGEPQPATPSGSLPPRKRRFGVTPHHAASSAPPPPPTISTTAADAARLIDEAKLIEMELARRRAVAAAGSSRFGASSSSISSNFADKPYNMMSPHQPMPVVSSSNGNGMASRADVAAELEYELLTRSATATAMAMAHKPGMPASAVGRTTSHFLQGGTDQGGRQLLGNPYIPLQQQPHHQRSAGRREVFNPMLPTSSHNLGVFAEARAAEARAHDMYQSQRNLTQERLYQEALYQQQQQMLMGQQWRQENVAAAKTAMAHSQEVLPNDLTFEDMMAITKLSKSSLNETSTPSQDSNYAQSNQAIANGYVTPAIQDHRLKSMCFPRDSNFLNEAHCFLRSVCIEAFFVSNLCPPSRKSLDTNTNSKQVGFRCIHCKNSPHQKANGAEWYPSKLKDIYKSVHEYQKENGHFYACTHIPEQMKLQYKEMLHRGNKDGKRNKKAARAYYAHCAAEMGLVDGPHGYLEFRGDSAKKSMVSNTVEKILLKSDKTEEEDGGESQKKDAGSSFQSRDEKRTSFSSSSINASAPAAAHVDDIKYCKFISIASDTTKEVLDLAQQESTSFVSPDDFASVSDYVYLLYHQLLPCKPTQATIKRRRLNPDQLKHITGFCCKHCHKNTNDTHGIANGMYFPLGVESLRDSSFDQTLMLHLSGCSGVPQEVKHALEELKGLAKKYKSTVKRGAKKAFVERVWRRMEEYSKNDEPC